MIDDYRLPVGPSFVLIDSNGNIKKVIEGYDNTVIKELSELIKA